MTTGEGIEGAGAAAPVLVDARQSLGPASLDDLFPGEAEFRRSLQTYIVLLALAALVASFGLYADSVAAIIGAMVVAPLGGAIMALAGALVTGRTHWQRITLLQVVGGAAMVVAIGFAVSLLTPNILALTPQLAARTQPGIWDIGVALAAGAAGAYVAARRTGDDALPGVAIAVSLVPPLATVGICLELGRYPEALGAFLLFATNFAAILVIASIVFLLFGYAPSPTALRERRRLRNRFILAVLVRRGRRAARRLRRRRGRRDAPVAQGRAGRRDVDRGPRARRHELGDRGRPGHAGARGARRASPGLGPRDRARGRLRAAGLARDPVHAGGDRPGGRRSLTPSRGSRGGRRRSIDDSPGNSDNSTRD